MTRLPGDALLPLGVMDTTAHRSFPGISSPSSSIMSPLTLPRGVSGYFDDLTVSGRAKRDSLPATAARHTSGTLTGAFRHNKHPQVYSPLSPGLRGPGVPQSLQLLSPHLTPYQTPCQPRQHAQRRSATTSPTLHKTDSARRSMASPPLTNPATSSLPASASNGLPPSLPEYMSGTAIPPISAVSAGHPQAHSANAAAVPAQTHMVQRLVQQNGRIREAWEAERKYMEANRERVEEVYKEERALMEEERVEWDLEKETLLRKIALLERQVAGLCGYSRLTKNDVLETGKDRRGGGWDLSPESWTSSASSQGTRTAQPSQRNRSGDDASHRTNPAKTRAKAPLSPDFEFGQHHPFAPFSPTNQPESSPFIPTTDRSITGDNNSTHDNNSSSSSSSNNNNHSMASPPREDSTPVPVVDVQEIIPTSEGIPIKTSAVQKTTFSDGQGSPSVSARSRPTSRTPSRSPPADPSRLGAALKPAKEQTLQVLAADETLRLTMHAGHTPNHSLSVLPTVTATTASSSGEVTPTLMQMDVASSTSTVSLSEPPEPPATAQTTDVGVDGSLGEDILFNAEPEEDRPLKGPLMVRNMPVHDEIFFKELSDKLEEVSKGSDASVPTVLRDVVEPENPSDKPVPEDATEAPLGLDGLPNARSERDRSSPRSSDGEEMEVPLKIRKSNNFGAPFGVFR